MLNTYREAVRAKVLHGLFAVALVTAGYCVVVGQFSGEAPRTLSDLGSATVALYGAFVSIVLSATALHREIELKTLFPILARPIARWEYVLGKYLGTLFTLAVFVTGNTAVFLLALAATGEHAHWAPLAALAACVALPTLLAWRVPALRTFAPALAAALLVFVGAFLVARARRPAHVDGIGAAHRVRGRRGVGDRAPVLRVLIALPHGRIHVGCVYRRALCGHARQAARAPVW
jgi:membrane protein implicated in regulation of membrane protease activity